jgi:hypothetical protein
VRLSLFDEMLARELTDVSQTLKVRPLGQRITVSGLTMTIVFRIDGKNRYSQTKISRSMFRSRTRERDLRLKTITC